MKKMKPLHIVVDAGNGCANVAFAPLEKYLPFKFSYIDMQPDGLFPNGVPNPMLEECRKKLVDTVLKERMNLGIAWDGGTLTAASSLMKMANLSKATTW